MEWTKEQLEDMINSAIAKNNGMVKEQIDNRLKEVIKSSLGEIGKDFVTKQELKDFQTAVSQDIAKTNETVNKIASETETKIKQLQATPKDVKKSWFDRELI